MKRWLNSVAILAYCVALSATLPAPAVGADIAFAADMVQRSPQGVVSKGKLFVSGPKRRTSVSRNGTSMINIVDAARGIGWILFPEKKAYMKQVGAGIPPATGAAAEPCLAMPDAECRRMGQEDVAGRATDKWEIHYRQQGMSLTAYQWIDRERHIPLRQEFPGGQRSELRFVGTEQFEGRTVEKWEMTSSQTNKAPARSYQWYDPELAQAVRQEFPGGYVSELNNIQVGAQADSLFQVPAQYHEVASPTTGDGPAPAASR